MKEIEAKNYPEIYEELGIDTSELGCLMADIDLGDIGNVDEDIYAEDGDKEYLKGYVGDDAHMTIMYGFIKPAYVFKSQIDHLLAGEDMPEIEIEGVSYFEQEDSYCVHAQVKKTEQIERLNKLMRLLPSIQTYPEYKPHVTIAYIKKDEKVRDEYIEKISPELIGKKFKIKELNYGDKNEEDILLEKVSIIIR